MKFRSTFFLIATSVVFLNSCKSVKDFTYLQNIKSEQIILDVQANNNEYKIRPKDNIYVSIKTLNPEVNQIFNPSSGSGYISGTQQMYGDLVSQSINGYQVDSVGNINLPILGDVRVKGLTAKEIQKHIQETASIYLKEPVVKVKLLSFKISITGEVAKPGTYYNYEGQVNLLEAISMAGGVTENADISEVVLLRQENDEIITHVLDLSNTSLFQSEVFYLHPSDNIYVKPGFNKKVELNIPTYSLLLSTITTFVGLQILYQPVRF